MRLALSALLLALAVPAGAAVQAPHLKTQSFEQLPQPLPLPYADIADARPLVDKARAKAKATHKLLLIDLGGNWCLDCRLLAATIELPDLAPWVRRHYEVVTVDIGRYDRNLAIPARYGLTERLKGVPSLLIVDPRTDKLLNPGRTPALADARSMTPQALADWLAQWVK